MDRVLSQAAHLRRSFPLFFIPLVPYPARFARHLPTRGRLCVGDSGIPIQPPPLRGTSFHRKEGVSTRAPSLGRGCRAQRGGVGFLFCGEAASSLPSPLGKGDRAAVDRVLSYIVDLRRSFPLVFHNASTLSGSLRSPPSPRGEGFVRRYSFSPHISCIRSDDARKAAFSYRCLPHWGRGTAPTVDRVLS